MVRIAISQAAFAAIAKTLALGSVGFENKVNEKGERLIWLEPNVVDRLRSLRWPGESYSDVILRMASLAGLRRAVSRSHKKPRAKGDRRGAGRAPAGGRESSAPNDQTRPAADGSDASGVRLRRL
jgi:hypothetical protein